MWPSKKMRCDNEKLMAFVQLKGSVERWRYLSKLGFVMFDKYNFWLLYRRSNFYVDNTENAFSFNREWRILFHLSLEEGYIRTYCRGSSVTTGLMYSVKLKVLGFSITWQQFTVLHSPHLIPRKQPSMQFIIKTTKKALQNNVFHWKYFLYKQITYEKKLIKNN